MKKKDIIIIAAVLAAALALFGVSQIAGGQEASTVVVTVEGREVLRRPLAMSDTYEIRAGRRRRQCDRGGKRRGLYEGSQLPRRTLHPSGQNEKRGQNSSSACRTSWWFAWRATARRTGRTIWTSSYSEEGAMNPIKGWLADAERTRIRGMWIPATAARAGNLHCRVVPHLAAVVALPESDGFRQGDQL